MAGWPWLAAAQLGTFEPNQATRNSQDMADFEVSPGHDSAYQLYHHVYSTFIYIAKNVHIYHMIYTWFMCIMCSFTSSQDRYGL